MKVKQLLPFASLVVIEAEEGCILQRKDIPWQKGRMFIIHEGSKGSYMEVERKIVRKDGQMLFGFMEEKR